MRLKVAEARALAERAMRSVGHDEGDARLIADHLIDCELRGVRYGGLARAITVIERFQRTGDRRRPLKVVRETPVSALLEGGDQLGYLAAHRATTVAIGKAKQSGVAMVGANDNWLSGMLSYYAEMVAREGLVAMMSAHAGPWVAPHGGAQGVFGTNPMCFAFPSTGDPIIWDIGTSAIMHAEVMLAKRLGKPLPKGVAFDAEGRPTRDPSAALSGAFAAWGGHKGSGLGLIVQLLGVMCGGPAMPNDDLAEFTFFIVAMNPAAFGDLEQFKRNVTAYAEAVRGSRPVAGGPPVRMPFDRSVVDRKRRLAEDAIEVEDAVHERILALTGG
jgi:LDH2 family malate/lactate/ureidoglycolate dehydrogenase